MNSSEPVRYVGRFAPSPTGPLHYGSLLAAVASYLQARSQNGKWLLRIEDIDPPREKPGADKLIIEALERYGFEWDGPVIYQHESTEWHRAIIADLRDRGFAYPCGCSRKRLSAAADGRLGKIYPGYCRGGCAAEEYAIRLRVPNEIIHFVDGLQGVVGLNPETESGDFIILRRDGLVAYHLAVVADDHRQGVTEIVRGIDLLESTPLHIYLQTLLGYPIPQYLHIPVAVNAEGQKLSKLTGARRIPLNDPAPILINALTDLNQGVPGSLAGATLATIWEWAIENWNIDTLRDRKTIALHNSPLA